MAYIKGFLLVLVKLAGVQLVFPLQNGFHVLEYLVMYQNLGNVTQIEYSLDGDVIGYFDFEQNKIVPQIKEFQSVTADEKNQDLIKMAPESGGICYNLFIMLFNAYPEKDKLQFQVEPVVALYPMSPAKKGKLNTLICMVSRFYPLVIQITWMKNNEEVTEGTNRSQYYSNDDHTFLMYAYLQTTMESGDIYTCTVGHISLAENRTVIWVWENEPEEQYGSGTAFCVLGLTIGVLGIVSGIILFTKSCKQHFPSHH